jgi:hypothetical protein
MRTEADLRQRRRHLIRYGLMRGLGDLVPEHCAGLCLARQFGDHRGRTPPAQHQRRAGLLIANWLAPKI